MTTREFNLAAVLGAVLGLGLVGVVGYVFVLSPYLEKSRQIKLREAEVVQLELDIEEVMLLKKKFEVARQQSLPGDVGVSREQYSNLLEGLCRRADFGPGMFKILVSEPDNKSVPMLAPKKPAYTRLSYELSLKGELYLLVDFLRNFYQQPLLHQVKKINIQRPSDARQRGRNELDVTLTVEALVLDNAPVRPTLLPVVREMALLSGAAAYTGYNMRVVAEGKGSPIPPAGVLAEAIREYLSIAGKNVFFGPAPKAPERREEPKPPPEEDLSPFITLTSVVGYEDGKIVAMLRDKTTNNDYTITQTAKGVITVLGEYELSGKRRVLKDYSKEKPGQLLVYGTEEGQNRRVWRVRRVLLDAVILEKVDVPTATEKPKLPPLAAVAGGVGLVVAVPEGKVYKVGMGNSLDMVSVEKRLAPAPTKYILLREAWRDIYAPLVVPTADVGTAGRGR